MRRVNQSSGHGVKKGRGWREDRAAIVYEAVKLHHLRRKIEVDRRAIWEQANVNRRFSPVDLDSGARVRRDDIPWELRTADDPNGRIQEMLARLARSATN